MSAPHGSLHRIWVLYSPDGAQQCVGAVSEGRVPGVVDNPPGAPLSFLAMRTFAWLGPLKPRRTTDGGTVAVAAVLMDRTPSRPPLGYACRTLDEAIKWLDWVRWELLAYGWIEGNFDPVNDPD